MLMRHNEERQLGELNTYMTLKRSRRKHQGTYLNLSKSSATKTVSFWGVGKSKNYLEQQNMESCEDP